VTIFILSLTVSLLTAALTIFSIFFNYDDKKPVKISKWGWIAVGVTILLTATSGIVKTAEHRSTQKKQAEAIKQKHEADSLTTILLNKNSQLTELILSFQDTSFKSLNNINSNVIANLKSLQNVASNMTSVWESMSDVRYSIDSVTIVIKYEWGILLSTEGFFERQIESHIIDRFGENYVHVYERMISDFEKRYSSRPWNPRNCMLWTYMGNWPERNFVASSFQTELSGPTSSTTMIYMVSQGTIELNESFCQRIRCLTYGLNTILIKYDTYDYYDYIPDSVLAIKKPVE